MDNRAIGVYDSGIGGTTVFRDLKNIMPTEKYLYFGDTKNLPYGTKTKDELLKISRVIFDFFEIQNVKAVVMACNTTSSMVYEEMKNKYSFELYPIIQTAAKCIAKRNEGKIGVLATIATTSTNKYKDELIKNNPNLDVIQMACPDWVKIVESGDYENPENIEIIKRSLIPVVEAGCKNIILGCTHYPYLTNVLRKITNNSINFINPSEDFTAFIQQDLEQKNLLSDIKKEQEVNFYVSSNPENFMKASKSFYELKKLPKLITL